MRNKIWRPLNTYGLLFVGFVTGTVITYALALI